MNPYTPTAEQLARFRQLIAHLRTMNQERFAFQFLHLTRSGGTVGCAIGQAIYLWPDLVSVSADQVEQPKGLSINGVPTVYWQIADELFGINARDAECIFTPNEQPRILPLCEEDATANEVADMLTGYLELYLETHSETPAV